MMLTRTCNESNSFNYSVKFDSNVDSGIEASLQPFNI